MTKMTGTAIGVDSCPGGWCVVVWPPDNQLKRCVVRSFSQVIALAQKEENPCIVVDMIIGLPECTQTGGRKCECAARKCLKPHASRVFSAPVRATLKAETYEEARSIQEDHYISDKDNKKGLSLSNQTCAMIPKIKEVDTFITPEKQEWIRECHPEICFWAMNAKKPVAPKKIENKINPEGIKKRRDLLVENCIPEKFLYNELSPERYSGKRLIKAAEDDFLDACAAAWTARRILNGEACKIPKGDSLCDAKGLAMEMWF